MYIHSLWLCLALIKRLFMFFEVIQLEYKSVISEEGTVVEIFMNGVTLTPSDDRTNAFDLMRPSSDSSAILHDALRILANRFNNTGSYNNIDCYCAY